MYQGQLLGLVAMEGEDFHNRNIFLQNLIFFVHD